MANPPATDLDEYSASSTIAPFDPPLPLLRGPLPSVPSFVLAFRDTHSWATAYKACESKLTSQCEAGARIGCAISATSKCRPPWWRSLFGTDLAEDREKCEERETAACFEAAKANCCKFAKEKCDPVFRDARIAIQDDTKVDWREASRLISWASSEGRFLGLALIGLDRMSSSWAEFRDGLEVNYIRGSHLLGTDDDDGVVDY